jgi:probable addiction module antidote protein
MIEKLTTYHPAEDLLDEQAMADFMADAFESKNAGYIAHALGVVARAKGMAQVARETGLSRESLYRAFSDDGNPTLKTILAVMGTLGMDLTAKARSSKMKVAPRKQTKTTSLIRRVSR